MYNPNVLGAIQQIYLWRSDYIPPWFYIPVFQICFIDIQTI